MSFVRKSGFGKNCPGSKSNGEPLYRPGLRVRARPATEDEWIRYDKASCSAADSAEETLFVYLMDFDRE